MTAFINERMNDFTALMVGMNNSARLALTRESITQKRGAYKIPLVMKNP